MCVQRALLAVFEARLGHVEFVVVEPSNAGNCPAGHYPFDRGAHCIFLPLGWPAVAGGQGGAKGYVRNAQCNGRPCSSPLFFLLGTQIRKLWLETPEQRQQNGRAVINLKLDPNVIAESDSFYLNKLVWAEGGERIDLQCVGINAGDYLIVSTTKRLNVAAGRVHSLQSDAVVMALERFGPFICLD